MRISYTFGGKLAGTPRKEKMTYAKNHYDETLQASIELLSHFSFGFKVQMGRIQLVVMAPKNPFFHPTPSSSPPLSSYLPPICGAGWDSNP